MRQARIYPAILAAALLVAGCAPRQARTPAPQASAPSSVESSANTPFTPPPGSASEMLLAAGFQVPRTDVNASNFTLKSLDGKDVSLASFKGRLVFLSFWATWCGPCNAELPSIKVLFEKLNTKGLTVLAVDVGEDLPTVSAFVKANAMTFPVLLDPKSTVGSQYDAGSIPTNYLIDRDGKILGRIVGYDGFEWTSPRRLALFQKLLSR